MIAKQQFFCEKQNGIYKKKVFTEYSKFIHEYTSKDFLQNWSYSIEN